MSFTSVCGKLDKSADSRGFPKVDHSGINARIVLEQNKFTKKGYL